jgi:hypothetical protein
LVKDGGKIGNRNKAGKDRSGEENEGRRKEIFEREVYVEITAGHNSCVVKEYRYRDAKGLKL